MAIQSDQRKLVSFATAWGPQFGGINAFNIDLLTAIAAGFFGRITTICLVPQAAPEAISAAKACGVCLVALNASEERSLCTDLEPLAWEALSQQFGINAFDDNTVWLGHDRITGAIALKAREKRGGKAALIHHMSYAHYEAFAAGSAMADEKVKEQKALFLKADYLLAVGPLLKAALADLVEHDTSTCLIPGLADIEPRKLPSKTFQAFLSGRLSEDAKKIKQAHLGLAGFGHAVAMCDADEGRPDALMGKNAPRMKLRGLDVEEQRCGEPSEAEIDLCQFVENYANRRLTLSVLPFTQDRQILFDDLREASVALMPSWHEGFGLVAWEAIAAGVPLILSRKSGVYKLLDQAHQSNLVLPIDPMGATAAPYFQDADKVAVANALIQVAKKKIEWGQKSAKLRMSLLNDYTWQKCAHVFVNAVGWNLELPISALPEVAEAPTSTAANAIASPQLAPTPLEIPRKNWVSGKGYAISQLLRAEEAIIPFDPARRPFLDEQKAWACGTPFPLAVRLLTGQGGSGKTRLAIELCGQLVAHGWAAGFLPEQTNPNRLREICGQLIAVAKAGKPVLVVVDYSETRQAAILEMLAAILDAGVLKAHFRLLLLARSGGEWWAQFPSKVSTCESLLLGAATTGPYVLPALHAAPEARQDAYRVALYCFAKELQLPVPTVTPPLSEDHFEQPLYVQMAALMALHGARPTTADALTRTLLGHEKRYWEKTTSQVTPITAQACTAFMAMATLAGGFATVLDMEKPWVSAGWAKGDLKLLWQCLQPLYSDGQGLQGLRPDLVGEALVAQALLGDDGESLLRALLGADRADWRNTTLTVLARVLRTRQDVDGPIKDALKEHFVNCALDICTVCIETPSPLTQLAVDSFKTITPQQKAQVARILRPVFDSEALPLNSLSVAVFEAECQRLGFRRNRTFHEKHEYCEALSILAIIYRRNGQIKEALNTSNQVLVVSRILNAMNPQGTRELFARDLDNYGVFLADSGLYRQALSYSEQALDIRQTLAKELPQNFLPIWVTSLNNHAVGLANNGLHDQALAMSKQALEIQQQLEQEQPKRFTPMLATCLGNLAGRLAESGEHQQALAHSKKALDIQENLGRERPEKFMPDWLTDLNEHSKRMTESGHHKAALELCIRAIDIAKQLAETQPERFTPIYATTRSNYSARLADNGQYAEALSYARQANGTLQQLAQDQPERFMPDCATSLLNCSVRSANNGQYSEALSYSEQSMELAVQLAVARPERFTPFWAECLDNHATQQTANGNYPEALSYSEKALAIRKRLAQEQPGRYTADWASSLGNHALRLADIGEPAEALALSQQALEIRQQLVKEQPERYTSDLARSLGHHALRLAHIGEPAEALALSRQALTIRQQLVKAQPERNTSDLAESLSNHAVLLAECGEQAEALAVSRQALEIRRQLALGQPDKFKWDLAASNFNYAEFLADAGQMVPALDRATEAFGLMETLVALSPGAFSAQYDESRFQVAHYQWLASGASLIPAIEHPLKVVINRTQARPQFLQAALRLIADSSGPKNVVRELAADCRQTWAAMDRVQRRGMEAWLFIATSIFLRRMPDEALPDEDWSGRWERYCNQRQGRIPHWITMTMERCGGSLDNLGR